MVATPGLTAKHTPALRAGARVTLPEAEATAQTLRRFIEQSAIHYGAHPTETIDAARALDDIDAWLQDLTGRNVRIQL